MLLVKLLRFWLLLSGGLLLTKAAWAQSSGSCPVTPNAPACTFVAVDVRAPGQPVVEKLCVGRPVRFDFCSGRRPNVYQYQITPGNGVLPSPCGPGFTTSPVTYTPTQAGFITVTELTQSVTNTPIIYFRVYEVYDSPAPDFRVVACAPGSVQITLPGGPYDSYAVQIGNGAPVPAARNQVVTYSVPAGAASVTVAGLYADNTLCTNSATQPILQLPPPAPLAVQRITLQATTTQLDVAPVPTGYLYTVERADAANGYQPVPSAVQNSATSFTVPGAATGRYRLRASDVCGYTATSGAVPTLTLTATAAERRNQLTWQLLDDPVSYELTRNGVPVAVPLQPTTRTYTDTAVVCGVSYSYRLTARYAGGVTSVSDMVPVRATATQAPAAPRLFVTFDIRNRLELKASVVNFPATGQLTYLREGQVLITTASRNLLDSSLTTFTGSVAPCFQVRFVDDCANGSVDSAPFCPAVLAAELADPQGISVRLTWSALRGAPAVSTTDTLRYRLLVLNPDNTVLRTVAVSSRGTYLDAVPPTGQQVRYRLEVTGAGLPAPSYSNTTRVARTIQAYVPTAFTPNGDGLNDVLEVKGRFLQNYRFTVVDRNGREVFQSTSRSQTWDGRVGSQPPVLGAYVWRLEALDDAGKSVVQHGTVTILK